MRRFGAMTTVEFCRVGDPRRPAPEIAKVLKVEAARRGLLILNCDTYGSVLRLMLPLAILDAVFDE